MNHIQFDFKARYETLGNIDNPKRIWIVVHGYGQQAQYFIRKFKPLQDEDTLVIAPEGLHHFYLKGFDGRVGASWMTKEDRWTDIDNYLSYLNTIYKQVILPLVETDTEVNLLGFSQGGATAARWFNSFQRNIDAHISWASIYPPDLDITPCEKNKNNYFAIGDKDEYFSEHKLKETILFYKNLNYITFTFHGKHNIEPLTLKEILNQININK